MPLSPLALIGINAGLSGIGSFFNHWMQGRDRDHQNDFNMQMAGQQQRWNVEQWNREKQFALEQWERTNRYNSPQQQMARFKEAGLNPHLIYGQGSAGQAAPMATPDVKGYTRPEAANVTRGIDLFGDFNRFQNINAQTDNLQAQSELAKQNALLIATKNANEAITGKQKNLDYGIAKELRDTQIEAAKTNLEKLQHDTGRSEAEKILSQKSINPKVQKLKAEIKNTLIEGDIKKLRKDILKWEKSLHEWNLTPSDASLLRVIKALKDKFANGKTPKQGAAPYMWKF